MNILITGGAGYIGSHVAQQLHDAGHSLFTLDDLSTGHADAVRHGPLICGDVGEGATLDGLFATCPFGAVIHLAGSLNAPESLRRPLAYYRNNTANLVGLLERCARFGVRNFILSSSASVYGAPVGGIVDETTPLAPLHPYGASKAMVERILEDAAFSMGLRYVALRYFNVAGADPQLRNGPRAAGAAHLVRIACDVARGARSSLPVYGTDYPTPDGTCVRDFVHVDDVARAHVDALAYLAGGGTSEVLNCGYGRGHSVREVASALSRVTDREIPLAAQPRRAGDPAVLVANSDRIRKVLGWSPRHDDLEVILDTAWQWERARSRPHDVGPTAAIHAARVDHQSRGARDELVVERVMVGRQ